MVKKLEDMKFVLDEDSMVSPQKNLPDNVISSHLLYSLINGKEMGFSDDYLISLAKKLGLVIITKDKGLVMNCFENGVDVCIRMKSKDFTLFQAPKTRKIKTEEFGKLRDGSSDIQKLKELGLLNKKRKLNKLTRSNKEWLASWGKIILESSN